MAGLFTSLLQAALIAQIQSSPERSETPQSAAIPPTQTDTGALTFRLTTREVVLDLIALDEHGGPVSDLTSTELQISYFGAKRNRGIAPITSLHVIDPNAPLSSDAGKLVGFQITASCLERTTLHYQLAFRPRPDGWISGFHQISLTTTRRGVRLVYHHRYYVGETELPPRPPATGPDSVRKLLMKDACYYPDSPLSISLHARLIDNGRSGFLRLQVAVDASSLSYLTLEGDAAHKPTSSDRRVQVDYGVCGFNAAGRPIGFVEAPLDQVLTSADFARALARGFPQLLELQAVPSLALARIVVRDRPTGNLGATDVVFGEMTSIANQETNATENEVPHSGKAPVQDRLAAETADNLANYDRFVMGVVSGLILTPPQGPIGSFGSVVPASNSFCGDVYELKSSSRLPDFRELDPIGSLYTRTLDVPDQFFTNTEGIPGVTPRTNLFGIDYHAAFWIRNPGDYQFRMVSDDGSMLWIDDRRLVNLDGLHQADGASSTIHLDAGRHTMHVPYYQGAINAVALLLWVRPPGARDWQIFDLNNFTAPSPGSR